MIIYPIYKYIYYIGIVYYRYYIFIEIVCRKQFLYKINNVINSTNTQ